MAIATWKPKPPQLLVRTVLFITNSFAQFEAEIVIPAGQKLNIGKVGQQPVDSINPKYSGGGDQILLPQNYPPAWIKSIRDGKTGKVYSYSEFKNKFPEQVQR